MLKIFKDDFLYNLVNNTVFMLATILATVYLCFTVHSLKVENNLLRDNISQIQLHVTNIESKQTKLGMQLQTSLSAESVVLANMADEVKAQEVTLEQAQKDNALMLHQLKQLKREIRKLEHGYS